MSLGGKCRNSFNFLARVTVFILLSLICCFLATDKLANYTVSSAMMVERLFSNVTMFPDNSN